MAKFVITLMYNGEYQFFLKGDNEQRILHSEGFYNKTACETVVGLIKTQELNDESFAKMISIDGKYYFYFRPLYGDIIARSEEYESPSERDNSIEEVKKIISTALIEDMSNAHPGN